MCKYIEGNKCSLDHHCMCHPVSAVVEQSTFNQSAVISEMFSKRVELTPEPFGYLIHKEY